MCHISCGEGGTGQERVQSSEGYGGLVVMLSAVHAERGRWEIVSVQTLYLVLWFGAEEAKGSGESHCDMRVHRTCLLYTSPSPRDATLSRMPSSA